MRQTKLLQTFYSDTFPLPDVLGRAPGGQRPTRSEGEPILGRAWSAALGGALAGRGPRPLQLRLGFGQSSVSLWMQPRAQIQALLKSWDRILGTIGGEQGLGQKVQ